MSGLRETFEGQHCPEPTTGCWLWTGKAMPKGYGYFYRGKERHYAHRLSHELHKGPIPRGFDVCHRCDTPACVNPEHLFAGTRLDNVRDMIAKGRHAHGDRHGLRKHPERVPSGDRNGARVHPDKVVRGENASWSKVSVADVVEIRRLRSNGVLYKDIAVRFGISEGQASRIARGQNWTHLEVAP